MRGIYLSRKPIAGSRYKYLQMFSRVCDVSVSFRVSRERFLRYGFAIVKGDKCSDYKHALKARIPYILLQHDTWTIRAGQESADERAMIEGAASILFTSEEHVRWMSERYSLPEYRVVHLRPLAADLDFEPLPKLEGKHIVYAGGIATESMKDGMYGYRAYHDIFRTLIDAGWTVHVYPAWNTTDRTEGYEAIGCVVHEPVAQNALYRELSQYTVGFQGYAETGPQCYVKGCRPNKLWEYLAAGIPTVGYNTGDGAAIYAGKWGTVARTLKSLPGAAERASKMEIPDELRRAEIIDNDLASFRDLVDIALSKCAPKGSVRLARAVEYDGVRYPARSSIPRSLAYAMRDAGVIKGVGL